MPKDFFALMKGELLVGLLIIVLLFLKIGNKQRSNETLLRLINGLLLFNLAAGFFCIRPGNLFGNSFQTDPLRILEKNMLSLGTLIISLQAYDWLRQHKHVVEFYILLLSTLLGMFFMISAGNLLLFFVGLELSTIPLAALVNFDLDKKPSSEAAIKFILSSAFSSGLLLFGISMLYGTTGTIEFAILPQRLDGDPLQLFSMILVLTGFAFKISVVPFHLWTADVYEGAPVAVTSYLSVVSKAAILFVLTPVLYTVFKSPGDTWVPILFLLSILTIIVGNLFALRQQNMKRFLAFSSISQMGFILIGIGGQSAEGRSAVIYFLLIYIFSNLGAFGVVALMSARAGRERIDDYKGFYKSHPALSWVLAISLFSLAGIPPTAGFFGKFFLLLAGAGKAHYWLIALAALNMVISLYYYLRIVKAMFMDESREPVEKMRTGMPAKIALTVCVGGILVTGLASGAYQYMHSLIAR
ncbi:MAG: NADH-quinone oxidoreductase subunit N [Puia sp.]|nr:NADH-quinone oxidoreductase subunit N [Puia sp.]